MLRTLDTETVLLGRLCLLNRQFHDTLGTAESRHQLNHQAREVCQQSLHALAQEARLLQEQLLSLHRAFMDTYPA
jgi:hypothetical protein